MVASSNVGIFVIGSICTVDTVIPILELNVNLVPGTIFTFLVKFSNLINNGTVTILVIFVSFTLVF